MHLTKGQIAAAAIIFLVVGVIVLIPILAFISLQNSTAKALSPITQANEALRTQVSQLMNPTATIRPDPVTIINEVRSLARLETIQYTVEKVITAETGQGQFAVLFGDKLIFVAHGQVIAGLDLSKLQESDLQMEGEILRVRLPQPEVFVATINNEKSYVYDRQTGILRREVVDLETQARQAAEKEILTAALEDGIIEQAKVNGEVYLERLFETLGYRDVIFEYTMPTATPQP